MYTLKESRRTPTLLNVRVVSVLTLFCPILWSTYQYQWDSIDRPHDYAATTSRRQRHYFSISIENTNSTDPSSNRKDNGLSRAWRGLKGKSSVQDVETAVLTLQNMIKVERKNTIVSAVYSLPLLA
jgi:hypothetical protein